MSKKQHLNDYIPSFASVQKSRSVQEMRNLSVQIVMIDFGLTFLFKDSCPEVPN